MTDLRIDLSDIRAAFADVWQLVLLILVRNRNVINFPSTNSFLESSVIKFTAQIQRVLKLVCNRFTWSADFELISFHYNNYSKYIEEKPIRNALHLPPNPKADYGGRIGLNLLNFGYARRSHFPHFKKI